MVKMTQDQINKLAADSLAEVTRLTVIQGQLKNRLSKLENSTGSTQDDLPEFYDDRAVVRNGNVTRRR